MNQFSGLDIARWINKYKETIDTSRINQIYRQGEMQVCFSLNTKANKQFLVVNLPFGLIISEKQPSAPHKETGFGGWLRRNIKGVIINDVRQIKSERIIEFVFNKGRMYFEFFNKGNIVICDNDNNILITLQKQITKNRSLNRGEEYVIPNSFDTFHSNEKEYRKYIESCLKEDELMTASKFFASKCILGGKNAEIICDMLGLTLQDELNKLVGKESKIIEVINELIDQERDFEKDIADFFSSEKDIAKSRHQAKIKKIQKIIEKQEKTLSKSKLDIDKNAEIGEFIYNNYLFFDELKQAFDYANEHNLEFNKDVIEKLKKKHNVNISVNYKNAILNFEIEK